MRLLNRLKYLITIIIAIVLAGVFVLNSFYPLYYVDEILEYSEEYELDPFLVLAIINVESNFNERALSHKEAKGLMQIGPNTGQWAAEEIGLESYYNEILYDPAINIRIGSWYLDRLSKEFDGRLNLIVPAYNAGSGNVRSWLEDSNYSEDGVNLTFIPFSETDKYVNRVDKNYRLYRSLYGRSLYKNSKLKQFYFTVIMKIRSVLRSIKEIF